MDGRRRLAIAVAAALVLALPTASEARVTIGSNLSGKPSTESAPGTWVNAALELGRRAAGGLRSPVNGVITRWRIRVGEKTAPVALRVIRPLGDGRYTGAGTGASMMPAANAITTFPAHLRIRRGDLVGNNTLGGLVSQFDPDASPDQTHLLFWFAPPLGDGVPGAVPNVNSGGWVNLINADIRPAARFKVKRVKPLTGGRYWVAIRLPNQGALRIGGDKIRVLAPGWRRVVVHPHSTGGALRIGFRPIHGGWFTRVVATSSR
jgi:hypothetical protein